MRRGGAVLCLGVGAWLLARGCGGETAANRIGDVPGDAAHSDGRADADVGAPDANVDARVDVWDAGAGDADAEADAGYRCSSGDRCIGCGGPCDGGHVCSAGYHSGGPVNIQCDCYQGNVVCCVSTSASGSCGYGDAQAPTCPSEAGYLGTPCEGPMVCPYDRCPGNPAPGFPVVTACTLFDGGWIWTGCFPPPPDGG